MARYLMATRKLSIRCRLTAGRTSRSALAEVEFADATGEAAEPLGDVPIATTNAGSPRGATQPPCILFVSPAYRG